MLTIRSQGAWVAELDRRLEQLRANRVAARLRVSEDAFWWYIQEFGSATHAERGSTGTQPRNSDGAYLIEPVYRTELVFEGEEGLKRAARVWHPGVFPQHFVANALDDIRKEFATQIAPLVATGQMNLAREVLISGVMQRVLRYITENIAQQLPGTNSYGRLGGQSAADNFEQNAELVDVSG